MTTKKSMNRILEASFAEVKGINFALESTTFGSSDLTEAIGAFRKRRPDTYTGTKRSEER
jgi:hypothetical protein